MIAYQSIFAKEKLLAFREGVLKVTIVRGDTVNASGGASKFWTTHTTDCGLGTGVDMKEGASPLHRDIAAPSWRLVEGCWLR